MVLAEICSKYLRGILCRRNIEGGELLFQLFRPRQAKQPPSLGTTNVSGIGHYLWNPCQPTKVSIKQSLINIGRLRTRNGSWVVKITNLSRSQSMSQMTRWVEVHGYIIPHFLCHRRQDGENLLMFLEFSKCCLCHLTIILRAEREINERKRKQSTLSKYLGQWACLEQRSKSSKQIYEW